MNNRPTLITARTVCHDAEHTGHDQVRLTFIPDDIDHRNCEWSRYTPALRLTMTVLPEIADRFEPGNGYTLTLEESD